MNWKSTHTPFVFILVLLAGLIVVALQLPAASNDPQGGAPTLDVALSVTRTIGAFREQVQTVSQTVAPPTATFPSAAATQTPFLVPESFYITGIFGTGQYFALGCEASAAVDWAKYFGVEIYEYNFQKELPLSDNPEFGFVGDAKGPWGQVPPYAYGVYAEPVAALLRVYGLDAVSGKGLTLNNVKESLAHSNPVIVWVIGKMEGGVPAEYTDKLGNKTIVAAYEHVVILTGYDADSVRYMSNGKFYDAPNEVFLNSWGVLGNMAVMHE